jgi:hypothetical protein
MSEDFSSMTTCVIDHGLFLPVARRLARDFGRVLYHSPWEKSYPTMHDGCVGFGFDNIERCDDIWAVKDDVDLWVFPDLYHQGLQAELRSQGRRVWGAGAAMRLELDRGFFMRTLGDLGLAVAPHKTIIGLSALADYLKDHEDVWIKISKWRGDFETEHWKSWDEDGYELDQWAVHFGPFKEHVPFLVFDKIDTTLEIGCDSYCVNGRWPAQVLHGIEKKDASYFSAVTAREDLPAELADILEAFSPFLAANHYACQFTCEIRVTENEAYFTDATTRGGLPSTASFLNASNVSEVIYAGGEGELVEIEYPFKFSAECMVNLCDKEDGWAAILDNPKLQPHFSPFNCCLADGKIWFPPNQPLQKEIEIGWLCSMGDKPAETIRNMLELAALMPGGVKVETESLADVLKIIKEEEADGMPFSEAKLPPPEIVLETA